MKKKCLKLLLMPAAGNCSTLSVEKKIQKLVPDYMAMGEKGMDDMQKMQMPGPANKLPMMGGEGPFGSVGMGGMFTILKVRDKIDDLEKAKASWYENPPGTVAKSINKGKEPEISTSGKPSQGKS